MFTYSLSRCVLTPLSLYVQTVFIRAPRDSVKQAKLISRIWLHSKVVTSLFRLYCRSCVLAFMIHLTLSNILSEHHTTSWSLRRLTRSLKKSSATVALHEIITAYHHHLIVIAGGRIDWVMATYSYFDLHCLHRFTKIFYRNDDEHEGGIGEVSSSHEKVSCGQRHGFLHCHMASG